MTAGALAPPAAGQTRGAWPASAPAGKGAAFIAARQEANGALLPGEPRADQVGDGVLALVAAGGSRDTIEKAVAYMATRPPQELTRGGQIGRLLMAVTAARHNPRDFGGANYVRALADKYNPATGAYDQGVYGHALAVLGMVAANESVPEQAITFIRVNECPNFGFGHDTGCPGGADADTTAIVLSALVAVRVAPADPIRVHTRDYLLGVAQNRTGGFGHRPGEPDNANSTGLVLSAIVALGENPTASPWTRPDGGGPVGVLLALQQSDGGFRFDASASAPDPYATFQAVPPLAGVPYPVPPRVTAATTSTTAAGSAPGRGGAATTTTAPAAGTPTTGPGGGGPATAPPTTSMAGPGGDGDVAGRRNPGADSPGGDSLPATLMGFAGLVLAGGAGFYLRRRART